MDREFTEVLLLAGQDHSLTRGPRCTATVKKLAKMIADKRQEQYPDIMGFIRTKLRFSLLRSPTWDS